MDYKGSAQEVLGAGRNVCYLDCCNIFMGVYVSQDSPNYTF